ASGDVVNQLLLLGDIFDRGIFRSGPRTACRGSHGAFRIEQVIMAGPQSEFDQSSGIGCRFRLPSLIGLIALHSRLRGSVPRSRRLSAHVVLANQGFLNGASTV